VAALGSGQLRAATRFGLLAIGLLIVAAGLYYEQIILLIFGGISISPISSRA
jgi:hypothetical protein